MSTVVMTKCWPLQMPPTRKAVLISLADNANDQGECWPSIPTICERTCFSERAVHRAIRELEADGLLSADRSNGRHTRYCITVGTPANLAEPPQQVRPRISGTTASAAVQPPQMRQSPPQMRQEPPQQVRSNHKEPSRTVRSNHQDTDVSALSELPADLRRDFLAVRRLKRAPVTETAIAGIRREAEKAGLAFPDAIRMCVERNWTGFKADWVQASNVVPLAHQPGGGRRAL